MGQTKCYKITEVCRNLFDNIHCIAQSHTMLTPVGFDGKGKTAAPHKLFIGSDGSSCHSFFLSLTEHGVVFNQRCPQNKATRRAGITICVHRKHIQGS